MTRREAAEIILAGRRAARTVGRDFEVDRDKLAAAGGFSASEMDKIEAAVLLIERHAAEILVRL